MHCQGFLVKLPNMKIPERYQVLSIKELGEYLGFSTPTVYTYLSREKWDKIPQPSVRLGSGPIWYQGDVEEWRDIRRSGDEV